MKFKRILGGLTVLSLIFNMSAVGFAFDNVKPADIQIVPPSEAYVDYLNNPEKYGAVIPPKFDIIKSDENRVLLQDVMPEKYDVRDFVGDAMPEVRNQGSSNNCWAYAAAAALEIGNIYRDKKVYSDNNILSESHIAAALWYRKGDERTFGINPDMGGNRNMASAYFARGGGPVYDGEFTKPYYDALSYPYSDEEYNKLISIKQKEQAVSSIFITDYIDMSSPAWEVDANKIKQALLEYGVLSTTYYSEETVDNGNGNQYSEYFNEDTDSYCYTGGLTAGNHAITLVGWDDTYSRENFKNPPQGDGAWIIRNSWGTGGILEDGYEYISYYDASFGQSTTAVIGGGEVYDNIDQYDMPGTPDFTFNLSSGILGIAGRFNANEAADGEGETLKTIGIFSPQEGINVRVKIDSNPSGEPKRFDDKNLNYAEFKDGSGEDSTKVFLTNSGQYLLELKNPIEIDGEYDVLVEFSEGSGSLKLEDNDYEAGAVSVSAVRGSDSYTINHKNTAGVSYIYTPRVQQGSGKFFDYVWSADTALLGGASFNYCLKGYTSNGNDPIETETPSGAPTPSMTANPKETEVPTTEPTETIEPTNKPVETPTAKPAGIEYQILDNALEFNLSALNAQQIPQDAQIMVCEYADGILLSAQILNFAGVENGKLNHALSGKQDCVKMFVWSDMNEIAPLWEGTEINF